MIFLGDSFGLVGINAWAVLPKPELSVANHHLILMLFHHVRLSFFTMIVIGLDS